MTRRDQSNLEQLLMKTCIIIIDLWVISQLFDNCENLQKLDSC